MSQKVTASVHPAGSLDVLSKYEVSLLTDPAHKPLKDIFRLCALAVLNTGSDSDNSQEILNAHKDFEVEILQNDRGVKLKVINAPASAFVDGEMIRGIQEHLFSTLRDLIYSHQQVLHSGRFDLSSSEDITSANFHILRNAGVLNPVNTLNLVVCWGGHAISREEYDYTKEVGYQLGLRNFDICTGCGPGAMKGPMKGAAVAHAKQRILDSRFIGISEPGIIAAEAPNPIVNKLVIMPDIEKRLEAFARLGHAIVVFPGGVGTAEELFYLLGLLLHPKNIDMPFPVILTGPEKSQDYFLSIREFVLKTLGETAAQKIQIIINDPEKVAQVISQDVKPVREYRKQNNDAFFFNWQLHIPESFQQPFSATHDDMASLNLSQQQPLHELAANIRRAFSGIVAGNVKAEGIAAISQFGPFKLKGDQEIMAELDRVLRSFVEQKRMKIGDEEYHPCYQLV
ncbi:nucleotide 5'-monophosphate nucleosidase PpnN [Pleionea litopenaei]|uniref:AMP nucleosidase n=1 Tax=Pleionea litopenaei TaxID=3070815 RepID=A0AA51RVF7_9GAMM|nr:nucleotide 5'-monophosphate nucleosidase PpnN [Pleionea sp. HL-JVS1]WMS88337.1 nucleotide 5'-monophosphate nucleosidase PpnN [Pleionea sp. HL-JVS1]